MAPDSNRTFLAGVAHLGPSPCTNYRALRISPAVSPVTSIVTTPRLQITPFAHTPNLCETSSMRKLQNIAATALAATIIFASSAAARQTPATNQSTTPPPAKTPASSQSSASGKTSTGATAQHRAAPAPLVLKTDKDKQSYAIGMNIGKSIHRDGVDVDPNILLRGMKDALAGGKTVLTEDEAKAVMLSLQTEVHKQQAEKAQLAGEANKKAGDAFLAANKTKEGVVTLPSGLQYKILTQGTGPKPTAADSVICNYRGTLIDGKEFDSSYKRGQPATFPVGQVIKGWTEALQLMPVGSKWQLFVPADLAYGDRGAGPDIGPGATLIFEVELISIKGKDQQ